MPQVIKKENLVISIRQYPDPADQSKMKNVWKQIGEIVTWQGDDGSTYQSFEMWGPTGTSKGKVFEQQDQNTQGQPQQQQQQPAYQQQAPAYQQQQQPQTSQAPYGQPQQPYVQK